MKAIEIKNVSLKIKDTVILNNVSFSVEKGAIYGLLGHNGAGKTSILRIILGLTTTFKGELFIFNDSNVEFQRSKIGAIMDSMTMDEKISARKYLANINRMLGKSDKSIIDNVLEKVGLNNDSEKRIKTFSLGMKRRLLIASALLGKPEMLVLDEPFNGIDPKGMAELRLLLIQLSHEGITVLVTSHIISELLKLSTCYGFMCDGKFCGQFTSEELADVCMNKYIVKTSKPSKHIEILTNTFNQCISTSNSPSEISVLGIEKVDKSILANMLEVDISDIEQRKMNEEDILLWKMGEIPKTSI